MRLTAFFFVSIFFILISCEKRNDEIIPVFKYQNNKKANELINAGSAFGIDLFRLILESENCPDNIMISPTSVAIALGMTYNGAEGETKTAFENTLRQTGLSREEINDIYKALIDYLIKADPKVIMEIANSIWYKLNFNVLETFKNVNKNYYYADVNELNFNNPNAVKTINDWIALKTHNKIKNVLSSIPADVMMYLINALYFNGMWSQEFNKDMSFTDDFYGKNGVVQVKYMKNKSSYRYFNNDLLNAIELPYGNGNFVMHIFVNKPGKSLEDIIQALTPANWKTWMGSFSSKTQVTVQIPKFKYDYRTSLNNPLTNMGLGNAFNPFSADFTGISQDDNLFISDVIHQTFIDVNEKGTEAAAVTVIEVSLTSLQPQETFFTADRPFIYSISEKNTGALLFMGKTGIPIYE